MSDLQSVAEKNARFKARGVYYRWLVQQYGSIPLMEMADDPDPISLRQIYIPLRLGEEDMDENAMNPPEKFEEETEANLLGVDAFTAVVNERFLVISGRPGAGKTTLVKALVHELCGDYDSRFRQQMQEKHGNVFVIPIILRELPRLAEVSSLAELLAMWWQRQAELNRLQAFVEALDLARLKASLELDRLTPLIIFDGVDEVGSLEVRERLFAFALQACDTLRFLVTGRPSGLEGINKQLTRFVNNDAIVQAWRYILPLTRPQIESFITKWYQLRPEWVMRFQSGTDDFRKALSDPNRAHLLSLARRPIFLALMALVHCTRNEMPHGRAALYRAIVDLYLERQQRNRRLKQRPDGSPMPQWDSNEPRIALGYLAWLSMQKGSEKAEDAGADERRIIWQKDDLLDTLRSLLSNSKQVRFSEIKLDQAESLLDYYLYPAGLLVEPAEGQIQFAHLSFQEYLCAEFLQARMTGLKLEKEWKEKILVMLSKPGWYEVALLLLAVHAERTQNQGHFELLGLLDLAQAEQARLFYLGLLGRELPVKDEERLQWLPALMIAAMLHPKLEEISKLSAWPKLAEAGLTYIIALLADFDPEQQWAFLLDKLEKNPPTYIQDNVALKEWQENAKQRWLNPVEGESWEVAFGAQEARNHAVLNLLIEASWGIDLEDSWQPLKDQRLDKLIASVCKEQDWLWKKTTEANQWECSRSLLYSEVLFNTQQASQFQLQQQTPLSAWLLQGEAFDTVIYIYDVVSFPSIFTSIYPEQALTIQRSRLSLAYYQYLQFLEFATISQQFEQRSRSLSLSRSLPWYANNKTLLADLEKVVDQTSPTDELVEPVYLAVLGFAYNWAAWDWFSEQVENPQLVIKRGGRVAEPLPKELGLFDEQGLPYTQQKWFNLVKLQAWASNPDNWLAWVFPEGLNAADEALLRADIAELQPHDWSPDGFMEAVLADWPEDQAEQDWSLETREQAMRQVIEQFLQEQGAGSQGDKPMRTLE